MSDRDFIEIIEDIKRKKGIDAALAQNAALLASNQFAISSANFNSAKAITQKELNEEIIKKIKKHRK